MDKPDGIIDLDFKLRRALLIIFYMVIVAGAFLFLYYARPAIQFILTILSPFIVALIVAYIFNPIVNALQRRFQLKRITGVIIAYAIILFITLLFFGVLVPILYIQLRNTVENVVNNWPQISSRIMSWLQVKVSPQEIEQAKQFLQSHLNFGSGTATAVAAQTADAARLITRIVSTALAVTIGFFAFVSFVVVICFYFLLDYNRMEYVARVLLPEDKEGPVFLIWKKIDSALGGFLRGQLIVCCIVGVIYTVVLMAMGMKQYAVLVGFLAGIGNIIPYIGPVAGGVPAGLWVLLGDQYDGTNEKLIGLGLIILLSIAVQTFDGFYMQPRIVGKNANIHPLLVLLALLIGAQFGLGGMIVAVPVAIMARVVLQELWWAPLARQEEENKRQAGLSGMAVLEHSKSEDPD